MARNYLHGATPLPAWRRRGIRSRRENVGRESGGSQASEAHHYSHAAYLFLPTESQNLPTGGADTELESRAAYLRRRGRTAQGAEAEVQWTGTALPLIMVLYLIEMRATSGHPRLVALYSEKDCDV